MQIEIDTTDLQNTLEQLYDRKVKLIAYASADGLDTLVLEGNEEDLFNFYLESFNPFNEWTSTDVVRSEFFAHILEEKKNSLKSLLEEYTSKILKSKHFMYL